MGSVDWEKMMYAVKYILSECVHENCNKVH